MHRRQRSGFAFSADPTRLPQIPRACADPTPYGWENADTLGSL